MVPRGGQLTFWWFLWPPTSGRISHQVCGGRSDQRASLAPPPPGWRPAFCPWASPARGTDSGGHGWGRKGGSGCVSGWVWCVNTERLWSDDTWKGSACGVAGPSSICQHPPPCAHTHTHTHTQTNAYTDTRFMYLCIAAAQLKGIWLEGVGRD